MTSGSPGKDIPRDSNFGISIIIPVYDRAAALTRCLEALAGHLDGRDAVEVLVCDDGSPDMMVELISALEKKFPCPLRYLRQEHRGPAEARNLGIRHARGQILVFIDSDCEPDDDWLYQIVRPFEDCRVGIVGGVIEARPDSPIGTRCLSYLMSSSLGAAGARDPRAWLHMQYVPRTGNMAVRRDLAVAVDGFSPHGYGEDLDFSARVIRLGTQVRFISAARVFHHEDARLVATFLKAIGKGVARVRLAKSHNLHEWVHAMPAVLCIYVASIIAISLSHPELLSLIAWPGVLYALALLVAGIHATIRLKSVWAACLVPAYAFVLHLGYGLGYLLACVKMLWPFSHTHCNKAQHVTAPPTRTARP